MIFFLTQCRAFCLLWKKPDHVGNETMCVQWMHNVCTMYVHQMYNVYTLSENTMNAQCVYNV